MNSVPASREPSFDRLYPRPSHSRFYHLTMLRQAMEHVVQHHVEGNSCKTLVDCGCGVMPYRSLFDPHISNYVGVDLPGNPIATTSFDQVLKIVPASTADIVLSNQVLEHVNDPGDYLELCRTLLAPDGLLILSTHGYWMYHPDPTDFWRWTSSGLQRLLNERGFEVLEMRGVMSLGATGVQLLQDGVIGRIRPRFRKPWIRLFQAMMQWVDKASSDEDRARDACVFVVVAKQSKGE